MEMCLSLGNLNYPNKNVRRTLLTFCFGEIVYYAILSVFLVNINNYRRPAVEKFVVKELS